MHVKQIGPYQISNRNGRGGGAVGKSGPTSGRLDVREFQPRQTQVVKIDSDSSIAKRLALGVTVFYMGMII